MNVLKFLEKIIYEAVFLGVADIHFYPSDKEVKMYYRIIGKLVYQDNIDIEVYKKIIRIIKYKSKLDPSITRIPQDGSFKEDINQDEVFFRTSLIPIIYGESLVIRVLYNNDKIAQINNYSEDLKIIYETIKNQTGLFIFTGPTGSGKTTTMYNILNKISELDYKKIITIENPIEIINDNFMQMQINEDMNLGYPLCLKSVLRQDPDIIMIGEIRDEETAKNVFRASLTGHTVISTMHTKDLIGVIQRFRDFGFLKSEIDSILIGISNQRLLVDKDNKLYPKYDFVINEDLRKMINE